MIGSLLGALCIYMLQQFLPSAGVSSDYLQLAYGVLLVAGIVLSTRYRATAATGSRHDHPTPRLPSR